MAKIPWVLLLEGYPNLTAIVFHTGWISMEMYCSIAVKRITEEAGMCNKCLKYQKDKYKIMSELLFFFFMGNFKEVITPLLIFYYSLKWALLLWFMVMKTKEWEWSGIKFLVINSNIYYKNYAQDLLTWSLCYWKGDLSYLN